MTQRSRKASEADGKHGSPLVKKLVEVLADLGPIEKSKRNPHFGYNYVGEGQIMAELRHRLSDRGVFLFTSVESIAPQYHDDPKRGVFVAVTTKHTFVDAESGEQFEVGGAGMGWDSGDKGPYKAITGATKYALMKNFLITDEQEPETGQQAPAAAPASGKHTRTRPYEEETGAGDQKVAGDLVELKAFLTEKKIPDGFLLTMLQEKKLIDGRTKNVAAIKPGILRRVLNKASLENLEKAWKQHQADEESGSATAPTARGQSSAAKGTRKGAQSEEIRTNEGDQRQASIKRKPITDDIDPADLLSQDGYENWREVKIHFGDQRGTTLGKLSAKSLLWWVQNWQPKPYKGTWNDKDILLDAALVLASLELAAARDE